MKRYWNWIKALLWHYVGRQKLEKQILSLRKLGKKKNKYETIAEAITDYLCNNYIPQ